MSVTGSQRPQESDKKEENGKNNVLFLMGKKEDYLVVGEHRQPEDLLREEETAQNKTITKRKTVYTVAGATATCSCGYEHKLTNKKHNRHKHFTRAGPRNRRANSR